MARNQPGKDRQDPVSELERAKMGRKRAEEVLRLLAEGTASAVGADFFSSLIEKLASALKIRYAFAAELLSGSPTRVKTLAFWQEDHLGENVEYTVAGTPCAAVLEGRTAYHPKDVQTLFPEDEILADLSAESYCGTPLLDASGKTLGLLGVIDDGPLERNLCELPAFRVLAARAAAELERKRAEDALQRSNSVLSSIFEGTTDAMYAKDLEGRYLRMNSAGARIFGMPVEEIIGQHDTALFTEEGARHIMECDRKVVQTRETVSIEETLTASGETRTYFTTKSPYLDDEGKVIGLVGVARDITEQKEAERQRLQFEAKIQQAQKLESLGLLAGGIAHDFNNLLTAILGNASLALMKLKPKSPLRNHVQQIETASVRAAELAKQMLAYSGKGKFVVEAMNLSKLVEEMAQLLQASISKNATLEYDLRPDLPAIEADATQVRQVVMNLITNASEALTGSGAIRISTGERTVERTYTSAPHLGTQLNKGNYVYVEVSDTGSGMDEETRTKIFDPFVTTKFTGRGLGLAAVLGIVRGHKGSIEVSSQPGDGTTFTVLFPASGRSAVEPVATPDIRECQARGTILVVDDEESIRAAVQLMLNEYGFEVVTASDGLQGVEIFRERSEDIVAVLLDMTMPKLDGEAAFMQLRGISPDIPVILMSGYNEHDIAERFEGKGLAGFVQKPFRPDTLIEMLQTFGG